MAVPFCAEVTGLVEPLLLVAFPGGLHKVVPLPAVQRVEVELLVLVVSFVPRCR